MEPGLAVYEVDDSEVDQYLETVIWSTNDESDESGGNPMDQSFTIDDFTPEARQQAREELQAFWDEARRVIAALERDGKEIDYSNWPHDFWLNRNGHGTGFWDKEDHYGDAAEPLSELAERAGERDVLVVRYPTEDENGLLEFSRPYPWARRWMKNASAAS